MQVKARERGVAMLYALALMVVVMGIATLMFTRTLGEIKHSADDAGIVQSLLLARGAANMGGAILEGPVQDALRPIVDARSNTASQWSFGTGSFKSATPTAQSVAAALNGGSSSLAAQLQPPIDRLLCNSSTPGKPLPIKTSQSGWATLRIYVTDTACGESLPSGVSLPAGHFLQGSPRTGADTALPQQYALPFVLVAEGHAGGYMRNVVVQGEYDFVVGRPSFAKYALFTNLHQTRSGGDVWFTHHTLFDGPVHTNQYFRFFLDPWFGGAVTSAGCSNPWPGCKADKPGAEFYGRKKFKKNPGQDPVVKNSYGTHAPELTAGVNWRAGYVPLPVNSQDQLDAAKNGGLYIPGSPSQVKLWAGDASGQALSPNGGSNGSQTTYQYIEVCGAGSGSSSGNGTVATFGIGGAGYVPAGYGNGGGYGDNNSGRGENGGGDHSGGNNHGGHWNGGGNNGGGNGDGGNGHGGGNNGGGNGNGSGGSGSNCTTYRYTRGGPLESNDGSGWTTVSADFNGVIYADGSITSITGPARVGNDTSTADSAPPAIASFAQITVAAKNSMTITGDLTYQDSPCTGDLQRGKNGKIDRASCNNMDAKNVLGLYVQDGDVLIGHGNGSYYQPSNLDAPPDVRIDGVLMSGTGIVGVQNHDQGSQNGSVHLLGGVIENYYGAFGTFDPYNGNEKTGYTRKFTYDPRMGQGLAPPHFPTVGGDSVKDVVLFSYGQREQVY